MAYTSIPTRTGGVDANSAADVNALMGNDDYLKALIDGKTIGNTVNLYSITADYTVLDDDGYLIILINPTGKTITVTFPTAAANTGRRLICIVTHAGGEVTLDGEGSETLDGATTFIMNRQYNYWSGYCTGTEWLSDGYYASMYTGGINTADWTNRDLGNVNLTYDNKSGSFAVGEIVTEYTDSGRTTPSGKTGIIMSDSGTVLVLKEVAGSGTFTNDYYLKGNTSLATAQVNGATKNQDTNVYHGFGKSQSLVTARFFMDDATTLTIDTCNEYAFAIGNDDGGNNTSINRIGVDTNNFNVQTGATGVCLVGTGGASTVVDTEDYTYSILAECKK